MLMSLPIVDDLPPRPTPSPRGRLDAYSLRVSVLEQCQLDCRYCRPGSMTTPTEKARWLTPIEHGRLARAFLALCLLLVTLAAWAFREPALAPWLALLAYGLTVTIWAMILLQRRPPSAA